MFFFEIKSWPFYFDNGFTLRSSLFGGVKLTKNSDPDKYSYFSYGISFDVHWSFSLPNGGFGKNVVIFGGDMSSSMRVNNKKDILFLVHGSTQGLDDTALTAETEYSLNFTNIGKELCLSLHNNENNNNLFVNGVKMF